MTARVSVYDLDDGARFLEALSCLVDRLGARTPRTSQLIARVFELLRCEAAQSTPNGFVGFQSERHRCLSEYIGDAIPLAGQRLMHE
jgi:hypothetical protein